MPSNCSPSRQALPHRRRPRAAARTSALGRRRAAPAVTTSSRHPKRATAREVVRRALVADGERGQAVDLVAPQVDAHRLVRRGGEDVDDAAAHGELAAVLDLVLAPVAPGHQLGQELARRRPARPRRITIGAVPSRGPSRWSRARTGATITRGGAGSAGVGRRRSARGARRGAGPSSRSRGSPARRAASPRPAGR